MSRGGGTITAGVTLYNQLGTATTTNDTNGATVPAHDISAYIDPVSSLTMQLFPRPISPAVSTTLFAATSAPLSIPTGPSASTLTIATTGDWAFYYHYDDATAINPIYQQAYQGRTNVPGFPNADSFAQPAVRHEQHQDLGSYRGERCSPAVFPYRGAHGAAGFQSHISAYAQFGFNTDPDHGRPDQHRNAGIPLVLADACSSTPLPSAITG